MDAIFFLPFELKKIESKSIIFTNEYWSYFYKIFGIRLILGLHSNLPWVYFSKMPVIFLENYLQSY